MLKPLLFPRTIQHLKKTGFTVFDVVGYLPMMLDEANPKSAREQLNDGYAHGGGWHPFPGHTFHDGLEPTLTYPEDPPLGAVAEWKLRDERIILFDSAWVAIVQPDGSYEIARMD